MGQRPSSTRRRTPAASSAPTSGNDDRLAAIYEILRRVTPGNAFPTWQTVAAIRANLELYAQGAVPALDGKPDARFACLIGDPVATARDILLSNASPPGGPFYINLKARTDHGTRTVIELTSVPTWPPLEASSIQLELWTTASDDEKQAVGKEAYVKFFEDGFVQAIVAVRKERKKMPGLKRIVEHPNCPAAVRNA